jgi:ribosomal protein L34E
MNRGKKYRHKRTSSETKKVFFEEKAKKKVCAIKGVNLSGTSRETKGKISKESKTQRRPSAPFGGVLGGKAREEVFIDPSKPGHRLYCTILSYLKVNPDFGVLSHGISFPMNRINGFLDQLIPHL